jgi:hypothetical protein
MTTQLFLFCFDILRRESAKLQTASPFQMAKTGRSGKPPALLGGAAAIRLFS